MDDLIRRHDAADFLCDWCGICPKEKRNIMECDDIAPNFAKIPSVDAVEVVRCKDCINSDWYKTIEGKRLCYCMVHGDHGHKETDFCSNGERKADG